jgi:hypothetical protein
MPFLWVIGAYATAAILAEQPIERVADASHVETTRRTFACSVAVGFVIKRLGNGRSPSGVRARGSGARLALRVR